MIVGVPLLPGSTVYSALLVSQGWCWQMLIGADWMWGAVCFKRDVPLNVVGLLRSLLWVMMMALWRCFL